MPVSFGTVQLVPSPSEPAASQSGGAAPSDQPKPPPPDARDLGPVLRKLHDRALRVRAT